MPEESKAVDVQEIEESLGQITGLIRNILMEKRPDLDNASLQEAATNTDMASLWLAKARTQHQLSKKR
ncbi:MAG: hypothetical protein ABIE47_08160 [Pseudomonadota bacterium]